MSLEESYFIAHDSFESALKQSEYFYPVMTKLRRTKIWFHWWISSIYLNNVLVPDICEFSE